MCIRRLVKYFSILVFLIFPSFNGLSKERPNIVWINCEDMDEILGCYGDPFAQTPNLDDLAKDGVLFENAFANAPICAPARHCLITGMYPTSTGAQHLRCSIELPDHVKPFPKTLQKAGYFTTNYAKTDFNFSPEGIFDYWKKDMAPWRKRKSNEPFFSFFVFGTTHEGPANFEERYLKAIANLPKDKLCDPDSVKLPPYYPDTQKMRQIWARYYDLAAAMDLEVGTIIKNLKSDGLWDNTIVWFFSDHGHGLPRHKRWLLDSGLRVPFILRIPEKYQHLRGSLIQGSSYSHPVSFVDFAPTVLSLAGVEIPENMQGLPFAGVHKSSPRKYVYGARDRADDMIEVSRAIHDGRFIYIRHFRPFEPFIQNSKIFGNQKESFAELRRSYKNGLRQDGTPDLFTPHKPIEEFYDLNVDPHEINNQIQNPIHTNRINQMRSDLRTWILDHRDTGFIAESDYTRRAQKADSSILEMAQNNNLYDLPQILKATFGEKATENDDGILYQQILQSSKSDFSVEQLEEWIDHPNPSIALLAAERVCLLAQSTKALNVILKHLQSEDPILQLESARAIVNIGTRALPGLKTIESVRKSLEGDHPTRLYKDFNYASFTGWALEYFLVEFAEYQWDDFDKATKP